MGDGGELKHLLDDMFGIRGMVRSCCAKQFEEKLCKHYNSLTVQKLLKNKFGQVIKISFDFVLCLVVSWKLQNLETHTNFSDCVQNVWAKSSLVNNICKPKNFLHSMKRPRYKFSATVLHRICRYSTL